VPLPEEVRRPTGRTRTRASAAPPSKSAPRGVESIAGDGGENNVFVGVGSNMVAMEVDATVGANEYVILTGTPSSISGTSPSSALF
jgi:hypothetical protein